MSVLEKENLLNYFKGLFYLFNISILYGQSRPGSNVNEGVHYTPQSSGTGTSPSDAVGKF